jgi:hypothetical protein
LPIPRQGFGPPNIGRNLAQTSGTRGGYRQIRQRADHLCCCDADAGGQCAVEGAFAEAAGEARRCLAEELAEQVVGEGDAAGGEHVREYQVRQRSSPKKPGRPP